MLKHQIVALFTVFFGLTATAIQANTVERIFPQAEQVSQRSEKGAHYLLPMGRVKEDRIAGRAAPSKFQRIQGDLDALTWKLPDELVLQDATQQVNDFLAEQNPERLFACDSRDCGDSFLWANSIFQEPVLFGSDRNQYLWVIKDREQPRYHVLYLIERPNRRIYLHEDSIVIPEGMETAEQVSLMLLRRGRVLVANVPFANGKADFSTVVARVKQWQSEVNIPVVLVVHRHGSAREADVLPDLLRQAVKSGGLSGEVVDVGPYAPDPNATGEVWVEWVNLTWTPDGTQAKVD